MTASPDLMRELLGMGTDALLSAEADGVCGAGWGQASPERVNRRNGYRRRNLDTGGGAIDVSVASCAPAATSPEWLLTRRQHAEAPLTPVVATCSPLGVTRSWPPTRWR